MRASHECGKFEAVGLGCRLGPHLTGRMVAWTAAGLLQEDCPRPQTAVLTCGALSCRASSPPTLQDCCEHPCKSRQESS
jgi:hypothetical protein